MTIYSRISRPILFFLILTAGLMGFHLVFNGKAAAQGSEKIMEDVMQDLMGEIRDEVNQDIKTKVRQDTAEVVAEETLSPSNTLSGFYVGSNQDGTITCTLTITPSSVSGSCPEPGGGVTLSGTSLDGIFYTFSFFDAFCGDNTGSATAKLLSGTGEPGTTLEINVITPTCGGVMETFKLVKQ